MRNVLSPRELAAAIGVSESSLKRWADDGTIRAARTAGGHRRIPVTEAIRFIRATSQPLVRPDLLGLPDVEAVAGRMPAADEEAARLLDYLRAGRAREARGLILSMYLAGRSVAAICDGPLQHAMTELGKLWRHDEAGIFEEHRATDICIQAINQLRLMLPAADDAPVAVGGAPSGDPYLLPSLAAAAVLSSCGLRAVNLGPDTPVSAIISAAVEHSAPLAWLSVSSAADPARLAREVGDLAGRLDEIGASVVIGGRAASDLRIAPSANLHVGETMMELAGFARGLLSGASNGPASEQARQAEEDDGLDA